MTYLGAPLSSNTDQWHTPPELFSALNAEFDFTLDAAASDDNTLVRHHYYTQEQDALTRPWRGVVFCNPPYGHGIGRWIQKCYESARAGATVVALIPAKTDTQWWHRYVMRAAEIRLVRGRLKFSGSPQPAPFPSCVVVFRNSLDPVVIRSINRDGSRA